MESVKPTILCTGPVDESFLSDPQNRDARIEVIPFTAISFDISNQTKQLVSEMLKQKAIVVFTSSNAVRSVVSLITGPLPDWTIYCIGNTTYSLTKKYFGEAAIRQTASTASQLAKKIIPDIESNEVIFFCGNLRRNELPDTLLQNGIVVKEIVVYHTSLAPVAVEKKYDAVIFFSPSAAESFFSKNTLPKNTSLFVMGNTTADSIRRYSTNPIITGQEPDKNTLIREAIDFVNDKRTETNQGQAL